MIDSISTTFELKPKSKYFDEMGDVCINVDGAIDLVRKTHTPEARAIWKAFRIKLVEVSRENALLDTEKMREEAFFRALHSLGIQTPMTPIKGTF